MKMTRSQMFVALSAFRSRLWHAQTRYVIRWTSAGVLIIDVMNA